MARHKKLFTFPLDDELAAGLRAVQATDGVSMAEQIRRGIRMWLEQKGSLNPQRHRVTNRKLRNRSRN